MPIDFRKEKFNDEIRALIMISREEIQTRGDKQLILRCVDDLLIKFMNYYATSQKQRFTNKLDAFNEGRKVYSEFLQNMVYLYLHDLSPDDLAQSDRDLIAALINKPDFFYFDEKTDRYTLWIDPKGGWTALISLCVTKDLDNINLFFKNLINKSKGRPNLQGQNYLGYQTNGHFSAVTCIVEEGSSDLLTSLFDSATIFCGGRRTREFKDFLLTMMGEKSSGLLIAAVKGYDNIVKLLLNIGIDAFHGDKEGFLKFINQKNDWGETALEMARVFKQGSIIKRLLEVSPEFTDNTTDHLTPSRKKREQEFCSLSPSTDLPAFSPFALEENKEEAVLSTKPRLKSLPLALPEENSENSDNENFNKSETKEPVFTFHNSTRTLKRKVLETLTENTALSPPMKTSIAKSCLETTGFYAMTDKRQVVMPHKKTLVITKHHTPEKQIIIRC